jgi:hypothetical protein
MPHISISSRKSAALAALILLLAGLGLTACGSSGSSTTTSADATATRPGGTTTGPNGVGPGAARFAKVRDCLQKQGITLPKFHPGARPYGGPGGLGGPGGTPSRSGRPQLPKGMTRSQYEAAIKKCGGGYFGRGRFPGAGARLKSPAYRQALAKFASCMRSNGVNVPAPNTSGSGPIFDTKGIDTASSQFKAAEAKCSGELRSAFRPGSGGGASPSGAPGT